MQCLEVSGGLRPIYGSLGVKRLIDNPMCTFNEGAQTPEHLIYDCKILRIPKEIFAASNKGQRRKLAHHQQRLGSKIPTRIFKI